jgi:ubiquinone/menaquinone biosynthesis C-methylase UbiE
MRCLLLLACLATLAHAEDKPRYETRKDHDPDGSGKFYMDREIALVMGHQAAGWLERPEREKEEQPKQLLKLLELKEGMTVADVGAGSGYHAARMAVLVGNKGKVHAVDIQPEMLALIKAKAKEQKLENIDPVLGTETDPKLPKASCDLIMLVDVYHELSHPYEMTANMLTALKPGGRIVLVEFKANDPKVPIKPVHTMTERQAIKEMEAFADLKHEKTISTLPWQNVLIFQKKK